MKYLNWALIVSLLPVVLISAAYAGTSERSAESLRRLRVWACETGIAKADLERALKIPGQKRLYFVDLGQHGQMKRLFFYEIGTGRISQATSRPRGAAFVTFDSLEAPQNPVCEPAQGDHRTDESFERTERLPMDSDLSQIEIHSGEDQGGLQ
ncbi:MAG: hypothetical protein KF767_14150 [Bdellovibrionaceae bacterium]|nr:hypothetical protein [Pseudobdellovibrionaceae bacterium]